MSSSKTKKTTSDSRFIESEIQNHLLEELPIGICRSDLKGTVLYVNKCFEEVTGYTRNEIIGRNALKSDLFPEDMRSYILKRIVARIGGAPSKKWDSRFKCKDGTWIWVTLEGTIIWKSGVPVGFQIAASDITERKKAEEALAKSESELRALSARQEAILASVPDIIMEVDKSKVYTWANSAGLEFFGADVVGKEAAFYFEGEQDTYDYVKPLFDGDENIIYVESWQRRRDGEKRLLSWWCRVLKDASGNITGALSTARDITERKRVEEELQKHREHLEELVQKRTAELEEKNTELERFNKLFVGREFRIKELKDKIKELEKELGENEDREAQ